MQELHLYALVLLVHYELFVVPQISTFATPSTPFFFTWLNLEILNTLLPERVARTNPRLVKKPVSKFRSKRLKHRGTGTRNRPHIFVILSTA